MLCLVFLEKPLSLHCLNPLSCNGSEKDLTYFVCGAHYFAHIYIQKAHLQLLMLYQIVMYIRYISNSEEITIAIILEL